MMMIHIFNNNINYYYYIYMYMYGIVPIHMNIINNQQSIIKQLNISAINATLIVHIKYIVHVQYIILFLISIYYPP